MNKGRDYQKKKLLYWCLASLTPPMPFWGRLGYNPQFVSIRSGTNLLLGMKARKMAKLIASSSSQ